MHWTCSFKFIFATRRKTANETNRLSFNIQSIDRRQLSVDSRLMFFFPQFLSRFFSLFVSSLLPAGSSETFPSLQRVYFFSSLLAIFRMKWKRYTNTFSVLLVCLLSPFHHFIVNRNDFCSHYYYTPAITEQISFFSYSLIPSTTTICFVIFVLQPPLVSY